MVMVILHQDLAERDPGDLDGTSTFQLSCLVVEVRPALCEVVLYVDPGLATIGILTRVVLESLSLLHNSGLDTAISKFNQNCSWMFSYSIGVTVLRQGILIPSRGWWAGRADTMGHLDVFQNNWGLHLHVPI